MTAGANQVFAPGPIKTRAPQHGELQKLSHGE